MGKALIAKNRRQFLTSLLSFRLGAALERTRCPWDTLNASADLAPDILRRSLPLFDHWKEAQAVGTGFLKNHESEAHIEVLVSTIFQGGIPPNESAQRAYVDEKQRLDFENADVVNVDGWLLSATEARLCAVWALANNGLL